MFAWIGKTIVKFIIVAVITSIGGNLTDKFAKSDNGVFLGWHIYRNGCSIIH
jgi:hypothetical protein